MPSAWPRAKLCYITDDGEGNYELRFVVNGESFAYDLSVDRAAYLMRDLAAFVHRSVAKPVVPPDGRA